FTKENSFSRFSDVAANEASNNDEASKKYKNDASRSRLSCLQSVAKHLLFSSCTDVTRDDIQRELPDVTEKELQTLMLIAQTLQPYIPDEETAFLNLPQSKTINANEIDINYMYRKNRKHLERLMKKASQGEDVSTLEAKLEKASLSASSNVEEFQQNYRVHEDCSKKSRSFYSSSNRTNRLRSLEI
ncbi:hypothetical protein CU097_001940, partial [Rhizopus azygosporus]